jgi:hypothetical protein
MRRRPRSLFRAQKRGPALYVGPQFVGPEPNYLPLLDVLHQAMGDLIKPGQVNHVFIYHHDWCAVFTGGPCDCNPEVKLVELALEPGKDPA